LLARVRRAAGHRRLIVELVRRDFRSRFSGARFGLLWSLLNPMIQLASYGLIFGFLYASPALGSERSFVASLFCGLWPWWAFQEGTTRGLAAVADQAALLKKLPMPAEACVVAAVTSSFLLQMIGFALFLVLFATFGVIAPRASWVLLPAIMTLEWLLTIGLALLLAPLFLVVRDTAHLVTAVLTIGFFLSPVLYPTELLPERLVSVANLNPMTALLGLYRFAALGDPWPTASSLLMLFAVTALLLVAGTRTFARLRPVLDQYW